MKMHKFKSCLYSVYFLEALLYTPIFLHSKQMYSRETSLEKTWNTGVGFTIKLMTKIYPKYTELFMTYDQS